MRIQQKRNWQMVGRKLCAVIGLPLINSAGVNAAFDPYGGKTSNVDYRVEGKIISTQGDNYVIRKPTGERVKLKVNENTNMFCENFSSGNSHSTNSSEFDYKGKSSKGFRIGNCPPVPGQYIKAETTDVGTVTFLRTMDPVDVKTKRMQSHTDRFGLAAAIYHGRGRRVRLFSCSA